MSLSLLVQRFRHLTAFEIQFADFPVIDHFRLEFGQACLSIDEDHTFIQGATVALINQNLTQIMVILNL